MRLPAEERLPLLLHGQDRQDALRVDARPVQQRQGDVRGGRLLTDVRGRVFLVGEGIGYSASPRMHQAAFRASGLDWSYELLDVPAAGLAEAVDRLRAGDVCGANVTVPHKSAVMSLLDGLEPVAARIGAVNTIVPRDGRLIGHNTDVTALESAARAMGFVGQAGVNAVILGAGGAARAAAVALEALCEAVVVVARQPQKVDFATRRLAWDHPSRSEVIRRADIVVNATPLGRHGETVVESQDLPRRAVIDLVYTKGGTPLVNSARAASLAVVDGWEVLVAQGGESFKLWTRLEAPVDVMREALAL